jgi:hypothetical protein
LIRFLRQPDLLHQGHLVIEELLLNDLPVLPVGYGAELYFELFPGRGDDLSIRTSHCSFECSREIGERAGIVTLAEEYLVRPVPNLVVGEGFEEDDCLFLDSRLWVGTAWPGQKTSTSFA